MREAQRAVRETEEPWVQGLTSALPKMAGEAGDARRDLEMVEFGLEMSDLWTDNGESELI